MSFSHLVATDGPSELIHPFAKAQKFCKKDWNQHGLDFLAHYQLCVFRSKFADWFAHVTFVEYKIQYRCFLVNQIAEECASFNLGQML